MFVNTIPYPFPGLPCRHKSNLKQNEPSSTWGHLVSEMGSPECQRWGPLGIRSEITWVSEMVSTGYQRWGHLGVRDGVTWCQRWDPLVSEMRSPGHQR